MNTGEKVEVNGVKLNVYSEGSGGVTIVFMAGNGVTCPVLEYKPIYRRMSNDYRIAVIEKAGYGFSGSAKTPRTIENLVSEDREALLKEFDNRCEQKRNSSDQRWEQVDVARGMAVFDKNEDESVSDVVRRADRLMYENKWLVKEKRAQQNNNL